MERARLFVLEELFGNFQEKKEVVKCWNIVRRKNNKVVEVELRAVVENNCY